jgi:hypothetical protein
MPGRRPEQSVECLHFNPLERQQMCVYLAPPRSAESTEHNCHDVGSGEAEQQQDGKDQKKPTPPDSPPTFGESPEETGPGIWHDAHA